MKESFPVIEKNLHGRCCFLLHLSHQRAAHVDATVGPMVIRYATLFDARDSADDALRGKIVLA